MTQVKVNKPLRVAHIGGGAAAVSFVGSVLARAESFAGGVEICIYEPGNLAHGRAFGPDLDCALMNLPSESLSILSHDDRNFLRWLEGGAERSGWAQGVANLGDSFVPRRIFGKYLGESFRKWRESATSRGADVSVRAETVTGISSTSGGTFLLRSDRAITEHSHVVLGIGPGSPADPFRLKDAPGFHADPYPLNEVLSRIDPHAPVLILGTGLTAVDITIGLLHLGHQGPLVMVSRNGIIPQVRVMRENRPLAYITEARIRAHVESAGELDFGVLLELLREELKSDGTDLATEFSWFHSSVSERDHLRHQVENPTRNPLQSILAGISIDLGNRIRLCLSDSAARFMTSQTQRLKSLQSPMPWQTGLALLAAMDSGQLSVVSRVSGVHREAGAFRAETGDGVRRVHQVIDATRTSPAATMGRSRSLVSSLNSNALATWDGHAGLRVEPGTSRVILPSGAPHPRLHAVGEITAGKTYYASSLPAVNRGADAVVEAIAHGLRRP